LSELKKESSDLPHNPSIPQVVFFLLLTLIFFKCAVSFDYANVTVDEATGGLFLHFSLSNPSMQASFFSISVTGSLLLYELISSSPFDLAAYQSSGNISLNILQDNIHQLNPISQLTVKVLAFGATLTAGNITQLTVNVKDVDVVPSVSLALSTGVVNEDSTSPVTITFTLSGKTAAKANVSYMCLLFQ
jgi:hypothetical protein